MVFFVLLGMVSLQAHAQTAVSSVALNPLPTLRAAQPATPVPATVYQSAFSGLPQGAEPVMKDWRAANAAVGEFPRGHADVLKWEQEQARSAQGAKP